MSQFPKSLVLRSNLGLEFENCQNSAFLMSKISKSLVLRSKFRTWVGKMCPNSVMNNRMPKVRDVVDKVEVATALS